MNCNSENFNPIIITGATGSIGKEITRHCMSNNYSIIMACRNTEKAKIKKNHLLNEIDTNSDIQIEFLDVSSLKSVKTFVEILKEKKITPRALVNNAGITNKNFELSPENGFEMTLATNYIGHYLLIRLLIPIMVDKSNIVNITSLTRYFCDINKNLFKPNINKYSQLKAYSESKVALTILTSEVARRYSDKIFSNVSDPGIVDTGIIKLNRWFDPLADKLFRPLIRSPYKGSIPITNALCTNKSNFIFTMHRNRQISNKFSNHVLKDWLWNETENIVSDYL